MIKNKRENSNNSSTSCSENRVWKIYDKSPEIAKGDL